MGSILPSGGGVLALAGDQEFRRRAQEAGDQEFLWLQMPPERVLLLVSSLLPCFS
jgi:hypothetical protein